MKKPKLDAVDVLNWEYLVEISEHTEADENGRASFDEALRGFAYSFTSTASEDNRNEMLRDILHNATCRNAKDTNEIFIAELSQILKCDYGLLRQFAKERGINLKRG